jgi:uncharacterized protein
MRKPLILLLLTLVAAPVSADPIAWRPWSNDVFEQAKKEHKFVLLDLEAIWCHWCHVMDETTYKDPDVQKLMADKYIAVKVDQDSRPDISNRYEDYGWPATVVFGDDGKEIVIRQGYIEPPAFISMLKAIIADPTPGPSVHAAPVIHAGGPSLTADVRAELIKRQNDTYDEQYGAWGRIQKFMDWDAVEYCMTASQAGDKQSERMAKGTLAGQLHLIDPVWGGVYQYSTNGDWDHPHFEKIMQMQAENLRTYANAYALWHDPVYLKAATDIHRFLTNFLLAPCGAFQTSMDADLIDGEHSAAYFALDDAGRRKQGVPHVDPHIYTRENGWAINALACLYAATGQKQALDEALSAAAWILANRPSFNGGLRHGDSDPAGPYLGDNVSMGRAMLTLYSVTGDRAWLERAQSQADFISSHFTAPNYVGVATFDLSTAGAVTPTPETDENVMVARFANLLFHYTGQAQDRKLAETAMSYLAAKEVAESRLFMVAGFLLADQEMTSDPLHVTIVGPKTRSAPAAELYTTAIGYYRPYRRLEWYDASEGPLPNADVQYPQLPRPAGFICTGSACSSPAFTPADLLRKLERTVGR